MLVLSVDPGYTTGTAVAQNCKDDENFDFIGSFEIDWAKRFSFFHTFFATNHTQLEAIIIERFKLTSDPKMLHNQIGSEMPSSRVIGLIESECARYGISNRLVVQWNSDYHNMRVLARDRVLVGLSKHNQVAYRHMRYYLRMRSKAAQR